MADAQGNRYGPYDIEVPGSESEALTEDAWFDLFGHISGVNSGGELTFNGLTANLSAIDARVHGSYLIRDDPWSDASPPTSTSAPRRDLLVGRRQRTSGEGAGAVPGKTFLTVLRGTPAGTPADPTHDPVNDELLFSWQVPGNGGTVITGVRDLRRTATARPPEIERGQGAVLDGSPSRNLPMIVKAFTAVVTTNQNGDSSVAFPGGEFPNGVATAVVSSGDIAGGNHAYAVVTGYPNRGAIFTRHYQPNGTVCANVSVRVNVFAAGW